MANRRKDRRAFIRGSLAAVGACAMAEPWAVFMRRADAGVTDQEDAGFGPLRPCLDQSTGLELLKLPEGFTYRSCSWAGDVMSDGRLTPADHDGMGVIQATPAGIVLCRNHEVSDDALAIGPAAATFDPHAPGGCTNLLVDPKTGELKKSWISLSGTSRNCAGGPTPWGTWLSCEETVQGPGDVYDENGDRRRPLQHEKDHGWVFEVPADGVADPQPLKAMGRFWHEAVAIDEKSGIVYLTEDRDSAGFYRFLPERPGHLAAGGRLEMLKVEGYQDLRKNVNRQAVFDVAWVPIDAPERAHSPNTHDTQGVYTQGKQQSATTFARLEGCWIQEGRVYIVSTSGGNVACGQVWVYDPGEKQLRLIFESPNADVLCMPDNMTMSPRGGIVLCEDSQRSVQRLRILTPSGKIVALADNHIRLAGERNQLSGDFRAQEWAGVTFSPDGKWLFANIQTPGITFAITGPWQDGLA